LTLLGLEPTI